MSRRPNQVERPSNQLANKKRAIWSWWRPSRRFLRLPRQASDSLPVCQCTTVLAPEGCRHRGSAVARGLSGAPDAARASGRPRLPRRAHRRERCRVVGALLPEVAIVVDGPLLRVRPARPHRGCSPPRLLTSSGGDRIRPAAATGAAVRAPPAVVLSRRERDVPSPRCGLTPAGSPITIHVLYNNTPTPSCGWSCRFGAAARRSWGERAKACSTSADRNGLRPPSPADGGACGAGERREIPTPCAGPRGGRRICGVMLQRSVPSAAFVAADRRFAPVRTGLPGARCVRQRSAYVTQHSARAGAASVRDQPAHRMMRDTRTLRSCRPSPRLCCPGDDESALGDDVRFVVRRRAGAGEQCVRDASPPRASRRLAATSSVGRVALPTAVSHRASRHTRPRRNPAPPRAKKKKQKRLSAAPSTNSESSGDQRIGSGRLNYALRRSAVLPRR